MTTQEKATLRLSDFILITPPAPKRAHGNHKWRAELGGIETQAEEKDDAVQQLHQEVEQALTGSYQPILLSYKGYIGLVWRTPTCQWCSRILSPEIIFEGKPKTVAMNTCYPTAEEAIRRLRNHLAQWIWSEHRDWTDAIAKELFRENEEEDREDFLHDCRWQTRFTELQYTGMNDDAVREQLRIERV
jgi:hypothetical protein